jgi:glycosyltransferase involved in cell wall biosynthesis
MRVAIDARPALDPLKTGVGHYTQELLHHLPAADPDTDYTAWYLHAKGVLRPRTFFPDVPGLRERATRLPARLYGPVSSRLGVPRIESLVDFDVFLETNFLPPPTRRRFVMVVHDLAFAVMPETAPHHDDRWHRRFQRALSEAARIVTPSAAAREDLVDRYPAARGRVDVIHHGLDRERIRLVTESEIGVVRRRFELAGSPYLLFLGGIEPRKNLVNLVRAFSALDSDVTSRLVIAGGPVNWFPKASAALDAEIARLPRGVRERVVRTGYVADDAKRALLQGATALAYPSWYEGFGLPILEAFAAGVPVLTSKVSSMPEVAGEAAVLVDPGDPGAIADGLRWLLQDEALRDRLRTAGRERLGAFTWGATARATATTLGRAADEG